MEAYPPYFSPMWLPLSASVCYTFWGGMSSGPAGYPTNRTSAGMGTSLKTRPQVRTAYLLMLLSLIRNPHHRSFGWRGSTNSQQGKNSGHRHGKWSKLSHSNSILELALFLLTINPWIGICPNSSCKKCRTGRYLRRFYKGFGTISEEFNCRWTPRNRRYRYSRAGFCSHCLFKSPLPP